MSMAKLLQIAVPSRGGDGTEPLLAAPAAPATPVGREPELERLRLALDAAAAGESRAVLVAGGAGVGKSSLIQMLRPLVETRGGRFVACKFDQHNERETAALLQALSALGRLMLAESGEERALVRGKILRALGAQAGLARVVPEFALLLADVPDARTVDPAHAAARMVEVVLGLLRVMASPARPLVLVLDDLQWSGALSMRLIDAVRAAPGLSGLLLVAAYRDDELPPEHPLVSAISRWIDEADGPELLSVSNLQVQQVAQVLTQAFGLSPSFALGLADALAPHAAGNPYDTLELANALRDEGLLTALTPALSREREREEPGTRRRLRTAAGEGSRWPDHAVQQYLARTGVKEVLAARIARLPSGGRELIQVLACMGAQTSHEVARAAVSLNPLEFEAALAILHDRGFVLREESADGVLRLRHDRVQQAAYATLQPTRRGEFHLAVARRLAQREGLDSVAADQYLCAVDEAQGIPESRRVVGLLRGRAAEARLIGNHHAAYRMQKAALILLERAHGIGDGDSGALAECEIDFHLALCSIGRLVEADEIYRRIVGRRPDALALVTAACAQVDSMANRALLDEAVEMGLSVLRDLGLRVPRHFGDDVDFSGHFESLRRWVESFDLERECARAETTVPRVVAAAKMIFRLLSVASTTNPKLLAWLIFQSQQLWEEYGPCAPLVVSFSRAGTATIALTQDWRTGYLAARLALDLCEARAWEPEASQVRFVFVATVICWFEPLERTLNESERAREGLLAGGDMRSATFAYRISAICLFECGPTLRRYAAEVEAALDLSRRADARQAIARCITDRQILRALLGESAYPQVPDIRQVSEGQYPAGGPAHDWVVSYQACGCAAICAIFADGPGLSRHARVAMNLRHALHFYRNVWAYWLTGLAAAWELQGTGGAKVAAGADPASELDASITWLRHRAIDAPFNFRHLHLHLLAERAWAAADWTAAVRGFDEALGAAEQTSRTWHRALITERAARLHLAQGWAYSGSRLLIEAQMLYAAWGATAKVAQLAAETATPGRGGSPRSATAAGGTVFEGKEVDTLAVLRASQALSSERSPARLKATVEEVLCSIAGATRVVLALWDEDAHGWVLPEADDSRETAAVPLAAAAQRVPLTAFRYAARTREPLMLADAVSDDRFARDTYFRGMERCSLMVVPIVREGVARAMLCLENRASRGAFSTVRMDAATMIAGQLAVSLESVQLYERLERTVGEQTRQLRETQARLVDEARRAGMAQIAINVLHNVGNLLTSVNVSAHVLTNRVRQSRALRVGDLAVLLEEQSQKLQGLFGEGGKGRMLPAYVRELAGALATEHDELLAELARLGGNVDHIKNVVAMQQSYAGANSGIQDISGD